MTKVYFSPVYMIVGNCLFQNLDELEKKSSYNQRSKFKNWSPKTPILNGIQKHYKLLLQLLSDILQGGHKSKKIAMNQQLAGAKYYYWDIEPKIKLEILFILICSSQFIAAQKC